MPSTQSKPKQKPSRQFEYTFTATGTEWHIEVFDHISSNVWSRVQSSIDAKVRNFEATFSRFKPDSWISQLAKSPGSFALPEDARAMLDLYKELHAISGESFTPLIGQTLVDTGYDASYSFQPKPSIISPPRWGDVMTYDSVGEMLTMHSAAQLDFGAIGKGYLVDLVAQILEEHDISGYIVDAGGDLRCSHPTSSLSFGLENPDVLGEVIGVAELKQGALCGSSGNRRRWSTFHHVIDPHTISSPEHIAAVWVRAETAILADGLATCLYFVPAATLKKKYTFEYILVMDNATAEVSRDFPGQLFT